MAIAICTANWLDLDCSCLPVPGFQNYHPSLGLRVSVFPAFMFHWTSMDSFKPVTSQCYLQSFNSCRRLTELFSVFLIFQQIFFRIWILKNRKFLSNAGKEPWDGNAQWAAGPVEKTHQQALWKGKQGAWWELGPGLQPVPGRLAWENRAEAHLQLSLD